MKSFQDLPVYFFATSCESLNDSKISYKKTNITLGKKIEKLIHVLLFAFHGICWGKIDCRKTANKIFLGILLCTMEQCVRIPKDVNLCDTSMKFPVECCRALGAFYCFLINHFQNQSFHK